MRNAFPCLPILFAAALAITPLFGETAFDDLAFSASARPETQESAGDASWTALEEPEREDLAALGLTPADLGTLRRACRTAFDVYADTPDFDNEKGKIARGGLCMGMCFLVRDIRSRIRFVAGGQRKGDLVAELAKSVASVNLKKGEIRGASSLRDLCRQEPSLKKGFMALAEVAMVRDLHPATVRAFLAGKTGLGKDRETVRWLADRAAKGKQSLVLYTDATPHVVLCYKVLEFEKQQLVYLYDPNQVYEPSRSDHRTTLLRLGGDPETLRLFPDAYDARYGGKYRKIRCAEPLGPYVAQKIGDALKRKVPALVKKGVEATRNFFSRLIGGAGRFFGNLSRAIVGGVGGLFVPKGNDDEPAVAASGTTAD